MFRTMVFYVKTLAIYFLLLIQCEVCTGAYTDLPNTATNRLAPAMAGQLASQGLGGENIVSSVRHSLKAGVFVGAVDAIARRVTSSFLQCPTQDFTAMAVTFGSSVSRAAISGLLFSYLNHVGVKINPIIYSGIYAAADFLITGPINLRNMQDSGSAIDQSPSSQTLLGRSLWQAAMASAFSFAGTVVGSFFPNHNHSASFITQMTLMYATAIAYIVYIEVSLAFIELRALGG